MNEKIITQIKQLNHIVNLYYECYTLLLYLGNRNECQEYLKMEFNVIYNMITHINELLIDIHLADLLTYYHCTKENKHILIDELENLEWIYPYKYDFQYQYTTIVIKELYHVLYSLSNTINSLDNQKLSTQIDCFLEQLNEDDSFWECSKC